MLTFVQAARKWVLVNGILWVQAACQPPKENNSASGSQVQPGALFIVSFHLCTGGGIARIGILRSATNDYDSTNSKMSVRVEDSRAQARQVHQSRYWARKLVQALRQTPWPRATARLERNCKKFPTILGSMGKFQSNRLPGAAKLRRLTEWSEELELIRSLILMLCAIAALALLIATIGAVLAMITGHVRWIELAWLSIAASLLAIVVSELWPKDRNLER
jgi:hypothetical protein